MQRMPVNIQAVFWHELRLMQDRIAPFDDPIMWGQILDGRQPLTIGQLTMSPCSHFWLCHAQNEPIQKFSKPC